MNYTFVDEGTVCGIRYVTVLDGGGNPIAYNLSYRVARKLYQREHTPAIDVMMGMFDDHDPWGSAMAMGFAVAEVSRAIDYLRPAHALNHRPGISRTKSLDDMADSEDEDEVPFETMCLADAVRNGHVDKSDLMFAARVLNRYLDLCVKAGKDY